VDEPTRSRIADVVVAVSLGSTKGSVHLCDGQSLPAGLLDQFLVRRITQIDRTAG
jgi:hypothetical protein